MTNTGGDEDSTGRGGAVKWILIAVAALLLGGFLLTTLVLQAIGEKRACSPGAAVVDPASVSAGPVAGYGKDQLVNAAIIAKVAADRGMPARAQLIGIMTAIGESSLVNIGYGDDLIGVTNPDGSLTCSLGLFQQQWCLGWGTREQVMDPVYAATKFYEGLAAVTGWEELSPTLAINKVQGNADPNHYARYEAAATEILAAIGGATSGSGCKGTVGAGNWTSPAVPGTVSSSEYGARWGRLHAGIDLPAGCGSPIYAAQAGTVRVAGVYGGYGTAVVIDHADGISTLYGHMPHGKAKVTVGQQVTPGQLIGEEGNTGNSYGCHLHFEIHLNEASIDPRPFMAERGIDFGPIARD